jgi:hypothetical protein
MNNQQEFVVDFIVRGDRSDEWKMVLVEEGEWLEPLSSRLSLIQRRLFNCIDVAVEGRLYERFPESKLKNLVISIDFYNAPEKEVAEFMDRFSKNVFLLAPYKDLLAQNVFVKSIRFEANFESIK